MPLVSLMPLPLHALAPVCLVQKQAPTFGAIPTAADVQKQRANEVEQAVWREEFVYQLLQPDALVRLNQTEQVNPAKVATVAEIPELLRTPLTRQPRVAHPLAPQPRVPCPAGGPSQGPTVLDGESGSQ